MVKTFDHRHDLEPNCLISPVLEVKVLTVSSCQEHIFVLKSKEQGLDVYNPGVSALFLKRVMLSGCHSQFVLDLLIAMDCNVEIAFRSWLHF